MFRIGEFSTIAQVSGRQLRNYDQLGLLKPVYTDVKTGYRYYSANQLPRLNRILALKELGFTLDQIGQLLEEDVSPNELRDMLHRKQIEIEQAMRESVMHLNYIESRIRQIEHTGTSHDEDVVLKSVPAQRYLSLRTIVSPSLATRASCCVRWSAFFQRLWEVERWD
jgi:DNA-binding transcriptional MerR regulator